MIAKRLTVLVSSFILTSCAGTGNTNFNNDYIIDDIILRNATNGAIEDVQIKVEKVNKIFSCNYILPKTECSTSFPQRPYEGNKVTISWKQSGRTIQTRPLKLTLGDELKKGVPMKGIVVIRDSMKYSAYFEQ